jgi:hypothetical protein
LNGWFVGRIGTKNLYLWCFSAFTCTSLLCGLAWSANSLIAFRVLQRMSGGLLAPIAQMMMARAAGKRMSSGACLALAGTLPLVYLAHHGLVIPLLAVALFIRGLGQSCVGVPTISAAYSAVAVQDLPMATTALNIVMRLGGATVTTICATFLGWQLTLARAPNAAQGAFMAAFGLLCAFQAMLIGATVRLPRRTEAAADESHAPESDSLDITSVR